MARENMKNLGFKPTLVDTLAELNLTRNALAVEAKIRPATVNELFNGEAKQVNFETLSAIINALNTKAGEDKYNIEDVFTYYDPRQKESAD